MIFLLPPTYKIDNLKSHNRQPNFFFVICIYGRHKIRDKTSPTPHLILIPEQKPLIGYFHINSSTKPVLKIKGLELFQEKKYLTGSFICLISKIHKYNRCCIHFGFKSSFTCKRKKNIRRKIFENQSTFRDPTFVLEEI